MPDGKFSISTTSKLGKQMIQAIQSVHAIGILHRDIKPGNWCMSIPRNERKASCYLIDFGLSRRFLSSQGSIREPREVFQISNDINIVYFRIS